MILAACLVAAAPGGVSQGGTLPNSVRVGDRSKMTIAGLPQPGARRIVLRPPAARARPQRDAPAAPKGPSDHDWFWALHSPSATAAGRARWAEALDSLTAHRRDGAGTVPARLMREVIARHGPQIAAAAERAGVSAALIAAVIAVESAGQDRAVSPKGAQGLMQLIPATARRFGVANSFDPAQNIGGGAAYLGWLLDRFGEDILLALAGYNAGEGAVDKHGGVPPYRETRDYVVKVLDAVAAAEGLCALAPTGPRAPCAFAVASQ
ncbi:MAG: lytic transglycosylase domain-containing protein [Thermohalobaculum sp.]|nr:lytic transglycosylase domain-containing protein [Thermohalobaculum sp.]